MLRFSSRMGSIKFYLSVLALLCVSCFGYEQLSDEDSYDSMVNRILKEYEDDDSKEFDRRSEEMDISNKESIYMPGVSPNHVSKHYRFISLNACKFPSNYLSD